MINPYPALLFELPSVVLQLSAQLSTSLAKLAGVALRLFDLSAEVVVFLGEAGLLWGEFTDRSGLFLQAAVGFRQLSFELVDVLFCIQLIGACGRKGEMKSASVRYALNKSPSFVPQIVKLEHFPTVLRNILEQLQLTCQYQLTSMYGKLIYIHVMQMAMLGYITLWLKKQPVWSVKVYIQCQSLTSTSQTILMSFHF